MKYLIKFILQSVAEMIRDKFNMKPDEDAEEETQAQEKAPKQTLNSTGETSIYIL